MGHPFDADFVFECRTMVGHFFHVYQPRGSIHARVPCSQAGIMLREASERVRAPARVVLSIRAFEHVTIASHQKTYRKIKKRTIAMTGS